MSTEKEHNKSAVKRKQFKKLKDTKNRKEFIQKYKLNSKRNYPTLNGFGSTSLSQAISKKIVHQIKKRNNKSKSRSPSKLVKTIMKDESDEQVAERKTSTENFDDDCICIESKPEVILIDDESTAPINVVKELEMKYLKFKQYEPIGKIRMNQFNSHMVTSTPNSNRLNGKITPRMPFHEDTGSSFTSILSSTVCSNTDDVTIVTSEKVNCQPTDVIVIDDTILPHTNIIRRRNKRNRSSNDDSVVFVSENFAGSNKTTASTPAFIPLVTPIEEVKIRLAPISPRSPRPKRHRNDLFTTQEEKQLKRYNENAYNPDKDTTKEQSQKRMVIVDGSNVAYQHALNKEFSVKGLKICLDYFAKIGHEVKAVVPQYRLQKQRSSDPNELETLHREGKIVFTPCKNLPGKSSTSYDDRFILQLASELDAAVVSNDNYRDLINENAAFKKIIENRVIGYTWCNDIFILPKDPYGKWGPTLATILNRS